MQKPIMHKTVEEWVNEQIKSMSPHSKKTHMEGWYFSTVGYDDVNVEFNRKICGYSNHHFTTESLMKFYGAEYCAFDTDGGIDIHFRSWNDVETDVDGCVTKIKKLKIST